MNKNVVEIDAARLNNELRKRNLTKVEVSRGLGYGDSYMTNVTFRGLIAEPAVKLLKSIYNMDYEDYKPLKNEPEPVKEVSPKIEVVIDYEKLYDAMYRAVRDALKG